MQYQSDIHTISKTAPPSYAEAMGQSAPMRDSPYIPVPGQTTTYNQIDRSQMSGYPSSTPAYQHPSNFYPSMPAQPAYNPSYVPMVQSQQNHPTVAPIIVRTETLGPRDERTFCERCATCNKKIAIALVFAVLSLYLIKVIVSRSM